MEHIRAEQGEPYFYFPWLNPRCENGEKGRGEKNDLEPVLDDEQRRFLWYGLGSSGRFMAFNLPQSFLEGPGVKSEDRYMAASTPGF